MTIAACYVCSEGVVFAADSTWAIPVHAYGEWLTHYFNHGQKILQIGDSGSLGILLWGVQTLGEVSCRTLVAKLADDLNTKAPASVKEVADRGVEVFWPEYVAAYAKEHARAVELRGKAGRTPDEDDELEELIDLVAGGACVGGCLLPSRTPQAFEVNFDLSLDAPEGPTQVPFGEIKHWGCPDLIARLLVGVDANFVDAIAKSEHWKGTTQQLYEVVAAAKTGLGQPSNLPLREAVDWVHASIYATIKVYKFTHLAPVCGGPIDVATITSDRPFRWVRRKNLDSAIL